MSATAVFVGGRLHGQYRELETDFDDWPPTTIEIHIHEPALFTPGEPPPAGPLVRSLYYTRTVSTLDDGPLWVYVAPADEWMSDEDA